ncbi:MAG: Na+/H+ antiporter subunit E [Planctomycetota bacterium]|nr:Na+/H+ antiporter subunit E [Planctomycetota bacterium]
MSLRTTLILAALWCVLTRELTVANLILGLAVGAGIALLLRHDRPERSDRARSSLVHRARAALILAVTFLWDLVISSVRMGVHVLRPQHTWREAIVPVAIETQSEGELTVLSALITLTPGTLTVDVAEDQRTLHVHVMTSGDPDAMRRDLEAGVVRHVRRLFA